jgi:hypothetical protein
MCIISQYKVAQKITHEMRFEALMVVNIKITISCDMVLYFGGKVQTFCGSCCLHLPVDYPEDSNLHIQKMFEKWSNKFVFIVMAVTLNMPIST